jgi:hypothetical protein
MFQVNDVVLDECIVHHIIHVQFELPGHRHLLFIRQVHEMRDDLVDL